MLPSGAGAVIAFFAVSAFGRIPAMLNFTAGVAGMKSALRTGQIKRIVTAHKFVELGKLEDADRRALGDLPRSSISKMCAKI